MLSKSFFTPFLLLLGCFFCAGAFCVAGDPCSAVILKVDVNFNR